MKTIIKNFRILTVAIVLILATFWASLASPRASVYARASEPLFLNPAINALVNESETTSIAKSDDFVDKTSLIYSPTAVCASGDILAVYDTFDSLIKVFQGGTLNSTISLEGVISLKFDNNLLFALTINSQLVVYDSTTFSEVAKIDNQNKTQGEDELYGVSGFSAYSPNPNVTYVITYREEEFNGSAYNTFEIYKLTRTEDDWEFFNYRLTLDRTRIQITSKISSIMLLEGESADSLSVLYTTGSVLAYFTFEPETSEHSLNSPQVIFTASSGQTLANLAMLTANEATYLALTDAQTLKLLNISISPSLSVNLAGFTLPINLTELSQCCAFENAFYYSLPSAPEVDKIIFNGSSFSTVSVVANGSLTTENLPADSFSYYTSSTNLSLLSSPFSTESIIVIPAGAHIAKIMTVKIGNSTLSDFGYCIYTTPTANYYGYLDLSHGLTKTTNDNYTQSSVNVYPNTPIFSLPTRVTDNINLRIALTNSITKLNVVDSDCNNTYLSADSRYILVELDNGTLGFVDAVRTQASTNHKVVVTNNATVTRSCNVYMENSKSSEAIDYIKQNDRVLVIGKEDRSTGLIKIKYVTATGNEITGFISAENIATDGWSVLQIVGLALIIFNVIFLVILYYVKKKINHD